LRNGNVIQSIILKKFICLPPRVEGKGGEKNTIRVDLLWALGNNAFIRKKCPLVATLTLRVKGRRR